VEALARSNNKIKSMSRKRSMDVEIIEFAPVLTWIDNKIKLVSPQNEQSSVVKRRRHNDNEIWASSAEDLFEESDNAPSNVSGAWWTRPDGGLSSPPLLKRKSQQEGMVREAICCICLSEHKHVALATAPSDDKRQISILSYMTNAPVAATRTRDVLVPLPVTTASLETCTHCDRMACNECRDECFLCCSSFCHGCSVVNYDLANDRIFCLECHAVELSSRDPAPTESRNDTEDMQLD